MGIYVTNDPVMNFWETLTDTLYCSWEKIYRLEIDPNYIKKIKLDREYHTEVYNKWDFQKELKSFQGNLMFYIPDPNPLYTPLTTPV